MWTRIYLLLLAVRFYFAISPSYIHPDENFQGPEVIAGKLSIFHNLDSSIASASFRGQPAEELPSRRLCMRLA
jgi:hypothetical protein